LFSKTKTKRRKKRWNLEKLGKAKTNGREVKGKWQEGE